MDQTIQICLPGLHALPGGTPAGSLPTKLPAPMPDLTGMQPLRFWPGLPGCPPAGYYCPPEYPFSPAEAAACLEDFRRLDATALSGMPFGQALTAGSGDAVRRSVENAALRAFAAEGEADAAGSAAFSRDLLRRQAQKLLLQLWLQEEQLEELAALNRQCAAGALRLAQALSEAPVTPVESVAPDTVCAGDVHSTAAPAPEAEGGLFAADPALRPSWRHAVAAAAVFAPAGAVFWPEGVMARQMVEDMGEVLAFRPAAEVLGQDVTAGNLSAVRASCGRVLGFTPGRALPEGTANIWEREYVWCVWSNGA